MTIEELLVELGIPGASFENDGDPEFQTYEVLVPRNILREVERKFYSGNSELDFGVRFEQIRPELVSADPGQFVRIYSNHEPDDDKSPIGIVTSVQEIDGQTFYTCSYIQIALGNRWNSDVYSFHITGEDYGGFHVGFLKVLTEDEFKEAVKNLIENGHKSAIEKANSMKETTLGHLDDFIQNLQGGATNTVKRWYPREDAEYAGLDNKIPRRPYKV